MRVGQIWYYHTFLADVSGSLLITAIQGRSISGFNFMSSILASVSNRVPSSGYSARTIIFLIPTLIAILLHSMQGVNVEYSEAPLVLPAFPNNAHCIMAFASA